MKQFAIVSILVATSSLLLLSSFTYAADSVTSPFRMNLDSASTQTLLSGISQFKAPSGEYKTDLPSILISTPYKVSITGIHLTLNYLFDTPTPAPALNQWNIQSKTISSEIVVDSINASQVIVEQQGGSTLTVSVNAVCTDVHLALAPGQSNITAVIDLALQNGKPQYTLDKFTANWSPSAWTITSMNCQGPNGFTQLLQQDVATTLKSINPFLPAIQEEIQDQFNAVANTPLIWNLIIPGNSHLALTIAPQNFQLAPGGDAIVDGQITFTYKNLTNTTCQKDITDPLSSPLTANTDSLLVPATTIQALIRCASLNGDLDYSLTSKQIPVFQTLLGNWFEKLIFWPDLTRFNKNSVFHFKVFPTTPPELEDLSADPTGALLFNLSLPVTVSMFAPEKGGPVHYLDLSTTLSGPASFSIENGTLQFQQKLSDLDLSARWDANFVKKHCPDQRIDTSLMASGLKSALETSGLSYPMPTWENPGSFSIAVKDSSFDGKDFTISLDVKKLSSPTQ
jgi:hypothetical protein